MSRTITGIIMIILGIGLTAWGLFNGITWFHGIPILIVGLFILFNNKEDKIERIKKHKGGK